MSMVSSRDRARSAEIADEWRNAQTDEDRERLIQEAVGLGGFAAAYAIARIAEHEATESYNPPFSGVLAELSYRASEDY